MAGSIREARTPEGAVRRDVWELRVDAGRDPVTGKRRQVSRTFRGSKREANKALAAMVTQVDRGGHRGTEETVGNLLAKYLDHIEPDRSPSTMVHYRRRVNTRLLPALGHIPLRKLRASDLDDLYRGLRKMGRKPGDIRQYHAIIRGALNQAMRWGWTDTNVALSASPPAVHRDEIQPPTVDVVLRLAELARSRDNEPFAVFIWLATATGARRGELCGLRWSDFTNDGWIVTIRRNIVDALGAGVDPVVKDTKTHAQRKVTIDEDTRAMLAYHHNAMLARAAEAGTKLARDAYVFSLELDCSKPWRPEYATLTFKRLCERLGVTGVRLHDTRHLAATLQLDAGIPLHAVSKRLGHRSASTTSDIYGHAVDGRDADAAEVMRRALGRGATPSPG